MIKLQNPNHLNFVENIHRNLKINLSFIYIFYDLDKKYYLIKLFLYTKLKEDFMP